MHAVSKIKVRYSETGAQGFVYHANYYAWFDIVQAEFLRKRGISIKRLEEEGVCFLPIDMQSRYYAPAYYEDELSVGMKVTALSNIKTHVEYEITRERDGALIAKCKATYACVSEGFRPLVLKNALPDLYAALKNAVEAE